MNDALKIIHQNNDWLTFVFIAILTILAFVKLLFSDQLKYTSVLFISKKYLLIYFGKEKRAVFNLFQISLFVIQILVISLLFQLIITHFELKFSQFKPIKLYFLLLFAVICYFGVRYFIGILIASLFNLKKKHEQIIHEKTNYLNNLILWVLPFFIITTYTVKFKLFFLKTTIIIGVILLVFRYTLLLINNKKLIFNNLFYFILYLCALEIAPLLIILKLAV
ncbi:protein of unknown function [Lutibacter oricola]|uniref:DUF4271 domain-containing protein n=1 Tax=Lutibacter oricola TaxID=762486 RepID=A0A1H2R9F1_9FLAO|nr:protein of unknown function [Lutibacter oricola]